MVNAHSISGISLGTKIRYAKIKELYGEKLVQNYGEQFNANKITYAKYFEKSHVTNDSFVNLLLDLFQRIEQIVIEK